MAWQAISRWIGRWLRVGCHIFRRRIVLEDALKFLFEQEESGRRGSYHDLARSLNMPLRCTDRIVMGLVQMGFAQRSGETIVLSEAGRQEALRIVRLHRLWEKYLAEETGLDPGDWHAKAHVLEHITPPEMAEGLVAQLGNPRFDPHGDPIPTETGEIKAVPGKPVTAMHPGDIAEITHMEDEPASTFRELVDRGLHLGDRVQIQKVSADGVTIQRQGEEIVLSPQAAANLQAKVIPNQEVELWKEKPATLADVGLQEECVVIGIAPSCRGLARRRLLDLGFVPGTRVRAELSSMGGDPMAFRVRNTLIALRKAQAAFILVKRETLTSAITKV